MKVEYIVSVPIPLTKEDLEEDLRINRLDEIEKVLNGGKNSGNHNPGQGRGRGKPDGGSRSISTMNYDEMYKVDGPGKWQKVASNLAYQMLDEIEKKHPELINKEEQEKNLKVYYDNEYVKWKEKRGIDSDYSFDEYKDKVIKREIDSDGRDFNSDAFHPIYLSSLYGGKASPFLEGLLMYSLGANIYFTNRKEWDEDHGLSKTIDKYDDLWTTYNKPLYRGVSTNSEGLETLKKGATISMGGLSSWSSEKDIADRFTKSALFKTGNIPVVFIDKSEKHDKTLFYPFSSAMGFNTQYEYVQSGSKQYRVNDIRKEGDTYYAEIESN